MKALLMRELLEEREEKMLSPWAALSKATQGRERAEEKCSLRTEYQRDRDRIIHSKAFRRLKHKTQVFISPEGDHYRTRLTHTLEVAQIARTIARALALNEDLAEAIALGHDLGHTPFGHAGEEALNEVFSQGFKHNEQSLRVVETIERGKGLNLTLEVRDGILNHTGPNLPFTLEGQIVRIADRIAYINHDIDDALRAGIINITDLPQDCLEVLGEEHSMRINTMVRDMVENSWEKDLIRMSPTVQQATDRLRTYLFDHVYIGSLAKREEEKAKRLIRDLFYFFAEYPEKIPSGMRRLEDDKERWACDYVAGMTDRYITFQYQKYFLPANWK